MKSGAFLVRPWSIDHMFVMSIVIALDGREITTIDIMWDGRYARSTVSIDYYARGGWYLLEEDDD